jgi:thioredoxin reductase (NADPH)
MPCSRRNVWAGQIMLSNVSMTGYIWYAAALVGLWLAIGVWRWHRERSAAARLRKAVEQGSTEPPSLHPVIDPAKCVGCGACTHACPEGKIIGMINGKAQLVDPGACIGHGACKTSCPVGAIELVFGSARRGVDIPLVTPDFQANVPGLYIAGELGGMGLISNAIEQGRQALESIAKRDDMKQSAPAGVQDVIIVGGGPAGIAASLTAKQKGLTYLTLEQDSLGGTVARYPRGKIVMTRPAILPLVGKVKFKRVRKERLLDLWQSVIAKTGIEVHQGVRVDKITPTSWGFDVTTSAGPLRARTVLLATGRRGSPRRLGIPGEDLPKVTYSLDDPAQYAGQHVMVVGGGDSAIEAALMLARHTVASVTLSYRGDTFDRARPANRTRLDEAVDHGRIHLILGSHVRSIARDHVIIDQPGRRTRVGNDTVIICAGGVLPTALLQDIGVTVERKFGTA